MKLKTFADENFKEIKNKPIRYAFTVKTFISCAAWLVLDRTIASVIAAGKAIKKEWS